MVSVSSSRARTCRVVVAADPLDMAMALATVPMSAAATRVSISEDPRSWDLSEKQFTGLHHGHCRNDVSHVEGGDFDPLNGEVADEFLM